MGAERRPLRSRELSIFQTAAAVLARAGVTPNQISIMSMVFATAPFYFFSKGVGYELWLAAFGIQLRLLCNLLDGMVAVEHKKGSAIGELFNEVPDRVADTLIILGIGFREGGNLPLALSAALVAMFTAYVRTTGVAAGAKAHFTGPMAKPHRMALLTALALAAPFLPGEGTYSFVRMSEGALWLIVVGGFVTSIRRLLRIADDLRSKKR